MGAHTSSTTQSAESLNQTQMDVLSQYGQSSSSSQQQSQSIVISNLSGDSVVSGINMTQAMTLDLTVMQAIDVNQQMQTDMTTQLENKLSQISTDLDISAYSSNRVENYTKVQSIVEQNFSTTVFQNMQLSSQQTQNLDITDSQNLTVEQIQMQQQADQVVKQVQNVTQQLMNNVLGIQTTSSDSQQEKKSTIVGWSDSVASVFSIDTSTVIMILAILVVMVFMGVLAQRSQDKKQQPVQDKKQQSVQDTEQPVQDPQHQLKV